jgi:hypothetical protein
MAVYKKLFQVSISPVHQENVPLERDREISIESTVGAPYFVVRAPYFVVNYSENRVV